MATVSVTSRGAERVRGRHLWVYRSDLTDASKAGPGQIVRVVDHRKRFLGTALYSSRSQIALRFIALQDREINRAFWGDRLDAAGRLRHQVVAGTTAYRLVYGEADLLPSLIVDRYGDCLVVQTLSQGMEALKEMWVELFAERYNPRCIIERNEGRVRELEGLPRQTGVLYGELPTELEVMDGVLRFTVDPLQGQKTGAFLDQRENRLAAGNYAQGRALDCFTFEGAFALHMALRANQVTAVDISEPSLQRARKNADINSITNVAFIEANVFDWLRKAEETGERFETVVLDPPAFAKNKGAVEAAYRGYKEINLRAIKLLSPGGILITSSCSYHMSEELFMQMLAEAATDAARYGQIIEKRGQSRDHPILVGMPETNYLKCVILKLD